MKLKHAIQIVTLLAVWMLLAMSARSETEQPPYEVKDPATAENFRNAFYAIDDMVRRIAEVEVSASTTSIGPTTDLVVNTVTASSITATTAFIGNVLLAPYPYIEVHEEQSAGTSAGTFTSGAFRNRNLNTVSTNTIPGASLSGTTVTLPSGTYYFEWQAPAFRVDNHQTLLHNTTDATNPLIGTSAFSSDPNDDPVTLSMGSGALTITSAKGFALRHRGATTTATSGLGLAANFGVTEVYAVLRIWRIK